MQRPESIVVNLNFLLLKFINPSSFMLLHCTCTVKIISDNDFSSWIQIGILFWKETEINLVSKYFQIYLTAVSTGLEIFLKIVTKNAGRSQLLIIMDIIQCRLLKTSMYRISLNKVRGH